MVEVCYQFGLPSLVSDSRHYFSFLFMKSGSKAGRGCCQCRTFNWHYKIIVIKEASERFGDLVFLDSLEVTDP